MLRTGRANHSIVLIAVYFGPLPEWFPLFLLSCELNHDISWVIYSDQVTDGALPGNVTIRHLLWSDMKRHVSGVLGMNYDPDDAYSICNLRPMFGRIFEHEIEGKDFFGWCDLDVIWGDIRAMYTDDVLAAANVISSDAAITSGHLLLVRNETWLRDAYLLIDGWKECLRRREIVPWEDSLDEAKLSSVFSPDPWIRAKYSDLKIPRRYWGANHFVQQFCTPFVPQRWHDDRWDHPEHWLWADGKMFNDRDENREFLYLHLMNFRARRWVNEELYSDSRTWADATGITRFRFTQGVRRYRISREGIWPEGEAAKAGQL